jgi:hypothetical protein
MKNIEACVEEVSEREIDDQSDNEEQAAMADF